MEENTGAPAPIRCFVRHLLRSLNWLMRSSSPLRINFGVSLKKDVQQYARMQSHMRWGSGEEVCHYQSE